MAVEEPAEKEWATDCEARGLNVDKSEGLVCDGLDCVACEPSLAVNTTAYGEIEDASRNEGRGGNGCVLYDFVQFRLAAPLRRLYQMNTHKQIPMNATPPTAPPIAGPITLRLPVDDGRVVDEGVGPLVLSEAVTVLVLSGTLICMVNMNTHFHKTEPLTYIQRSQIRCRV